MRFARAMVGILAEQEDLDVVVAGKGERGKNLILGRIDGLVLVFILLFTPSA